MPAERRIPPDSRELYAFRADPGVAELAARQFGVVSTAELFAQGMTRSAITRRRQRGHLHQLYPGVWAVGHAEPPWEGWLLAAVKACGPGALLSHYSVNELYGFVDRSERLPDVMVTSAGHRSRSAIRIHRCKGLDPIDRREHLGIPVTSVPLALLDLASMVSSSRARKAIRRALGMGKVTVRQLGLALHRYPGRRGTATLREAVASGAAPTKSEAESDVLDLVISLGFAHPDVNAPLLINGRRIVPDLRWPTRRLILEIDSDAWHSDPLARADDQERQALLERHGETVVRAHWRDALLRPGRLESMLAAASAPR